MFTRHPLEKQSNTQNWIGQMCDLTESTNDAWRRPLRAKMYVCCKDTNGTWVPNLRGKYSINNEIDVGQDSTNAYYCYEIMHEIVSQLEAFELLIC